METRTAAAGSTASAVYTPLTKNSTQFRVLVVQPGIEEDDLRCELRIMHMGSLPAPEYETISYVWGDGSQRATIFVDEAEMNVTLSSAKVLRRIRPTNDPRTVWIDALCINQVDDAERSQQVAMMGDIYRNGLANLIYWNDDDTLASEAVTSIRDILHEVKDGGFLEHIEYLRYLTASEKNVIACGYDANALIHMFSTPWLQRAWTFQEAILPKISICLYGKHSCLLLDVLHAFWRLFSNREFVGPGLSKCLRDIGSNLVSLSIQLDGVYRSKPELNRYRTPKYLAYCLRNRQCSRPVDKIYSFLGLIDDIGINIDYSREPTEVFQDFDIAMIRKFGNLELLQHVGSEPRSHLPTWVVDWSLCHDHRYPSPFTFSASGSGARNADFSIKREPGQAAILVARGITVTTVEDRTSTMDRLELIPNVRLACYRSIAAKALQCSGDDESVDSALAMVLTAGIDRHFEAWTTTQALPPFRAWASYIESGEDIPPPGERDTERAALTSKFQDCMEVACRGRVVFKGGEAFFGIGSANICEGDVLAMLYGGQWPAILRPVDDRYTFQCFVWVHGIMDGEIVRQREEQGHSKRDDDIFEIH